MDRKGGRGGGGGGGENEETQVCYLVLIRCISLIFE